RLPQTRIHQSSATGTASANGPLTIPSWASIGPHPASGKDDKYSGASPFGGRVTAVAPVGDGTTTYIGTAEGGVWKTTDSGTTWTPMFDAQSTLAIGAITVDPN